MFISLFKKQKNSTYYITHYTRYFLIVTILIFFSWLFLFIYKHIYFAIVQEVAILNLKSELVITRVERVKFNEIATKYKEKQDPTTIIKFDKIKNPFKYDAIDEK